MSSVLGYSYSQFSTYTYNVDTATNSIVIYVCYPLSSGATSTPYPNVVGSLQVTTQPANSTTAKGGRLVQIS